MIVNEYNLVKIEADGDNLLTDSANTNTFKKVTCKAEDVSKYIEISKEKAQEIMLAILNKANDFMENLVNKVSNSTDSEN